MSDTAGTNQRFFLRYQTDHVDYVLSEDELNRLAEGPHNSFKDFCLATIGIAIPCLLNTIAYIKNPFEWSYPLFLNSTIGGICFLAAIVLGFVWFGTRSNFNELVSAIRSKPKVQVQLISIDSASTTTTSNPSTTSGNA